MLKWLLIKLLNRQQRKWSEKLKSASFEYDCICLSDIEQSKVLMTKKNTIKNIELICKLKEVLFSE